MNASREHTGWKVQAHKILCFQRRDTADRIRRAGGETIRISNERDAKVKPFKDLSVSNAQAGENDAKSLL
jgi:hypothetical protein